LASSGNPEPRTLGSVRQNDSMHGHAHEPSELSAPKGLERKLLLALAPFALGTLIGLVALWPPADPLQADVPAQGDLYDATVKQVEEKDCPAEQPSAESLQCSTITVQMTEGPDDGDEVAFEFQGGRGTRQFEEGDAVVMVRPPNEQQTPGAPEYYFGDYQRSTPLLVLGILFGVVVIALSRWRGLAALVGLGVSILVLTRFILPAILAGESPLLVSIVGASVIMFAALYMSHGFNVVTTTAALGTLTSLAITGILAVIFVELAKFTGLATEEATFLQLSADQINLSGLLLGGIIIGALGVLDDVTVTQASAVWELRAANPSYGSKQLYGSALRIGRDHIASTVNTLVLAYAGASLPLLILFLTSESSVSSLLTNEIIAAEIVRTLVGSIGLVASVPITTALASAAAGSRTPSEQKDTPSEGPRPKSWRAPRREREWRESET
jgi:uncharacterized membrane protein